MTEQNGIDILCDAAGSDLLSSLFNNQQQSSVNEIGNGSQRPQAALNHDHPSLPQQQSQSHQPPPPAQNSQLPHHSTFSRTESRPDLIAASHSSASAHSGGILPSVARPANKRIRLGPDSASNHVCHICKRVYERADHLTRHLRSHENARPYQCSRCPKRFNRADLLTRHETTHDRNNSAKGRTFIRRSDRAAEACQNCASSKAKCDDQKPCSRCRAKNIRCYIPSRRVHQYRTSHDVSDGTSNPSPSECSTMLSGSHQHSQAPSTQNRHMMDAQPHLLPPPTAPQSHPQMPTEQMNNEQVNPYIHGILAQTTSVFGGMPEDLSYFNPLHNFLQDMEFSSWDMNFDNFTIPQIKSNELSPGSSGTNTSKPGCRLRDPSRGHAAFERSPWLWDPKPDDAHREKSIAGVNENGIANSSAFGTQRVSNPLGKLKMSQESRDRIFALVITQQKDAKKVKSFPSLDLLNYLMQAHFIQEDQLPDSWIHAGSFDPSKVIPELLAAIISSGATFISMKSIWQFGLTLQEVVRTGLSILFESSNTNTRDLMCLQSFMLILDIGLWSGFKRKTEIAESFVQPVMTMLRRAGSFSAPPENPSLMPSMSDSTDVLEMKWHNFIRRESFKRLVIHLFVHDTQSSIALQKKPLMSFTELAFPLPASRNLWKALSAEEWRFRYVAKTPLPEDEVAQMPRVSDVIQCIGILGEFEEHVDTELCYTAMLYGYWSQISSYREATRFYHNPPASIGLGNTMQRLIASKRPSHRLWLQSQQSELCRDLSEFAALIEGRSVAPTPTNQSPRDGRAHMGSNSPRPYPHLSILTELFKMILYVDPDDLQRFAGKYGEEEARRALAILENGWARTPDSRSAVWHAGQVIRAARHLPPASLRGFQAMTVYFAGLTLWVYGLLSTIPNEEGQDEALNSGYGQSSHDVIGGFGQSADMSSARNLGAREANNGERFVILDGPETRGTRAFVQLGRGIPVLSGLCSLAGSQGDSFPFRNHDDSFMVAGLGPSKIPQGEMYDGQEKSSSHPLHNRDTHEEFTPVTSSNGAANPVLVPLANPSDILELARKMMRENYPVRTEPLPPFVKSLCDLMMDLGSGNTDSLSPTTNDEREVP